MKQLYYRFLFFIVKQLKNAEAYYVSKNRLKNINEQCTYGEKTVFHKDCLIQNHIRNPELITIGGHTQIHSHLMIFGHGGKIRIGNYCYLGEQSKIWSAKEITIGDRVLISHNVNIHDNNSHPLDAELRHDDFKKIFSTGFQTQNNLNEKEIIIEDDVWIGFNSTILKGVRIGKGAIVAACSLVTKDVEPYTIVGGNPAIFIKHQKEI